MTNGSMASSLVGRLADFDDDAGFANLRLGSVGESVCVFFLMWQCRVVQPRGATGGEDEAMSRRMAKVISHRGPDCARRSESEPFAA